MDNDSQAFIAANLTPAAVAGTQKASGINDYAAFSRSRARREQNIVLQMDVGMEVPLELRQPVQPPKYWPGSEPYQLFGYQAVTFVVQSMTFALWRGYGKRETLKMAKDIFCYAVSIKR